MMRPLFGIVLIIFGINMQENVNGKFSCENRPSGYYADLETGCQIYHMCDGLGRQFSYSCPNATLFQQRMLVCDHWYMVNCSKSEVDFSANLLIGQRDKPFVEDSEKHPYHRTPRPDLLSNPDAQEYNVIYRTGRSQYVSDFNLVGIETEENESVVTDRPTYSLPSHWFTEFQKDVTTQRIDTKRNDFKQNKVVKTNQDFNENTKKSIPERPTKTKQKSPINQNEKYNSQKKYETNSEIAADFNNDFNSNFHLSSFSTESSIRVTSIRSISNVDIRNNDFTDNKHHQVNVNIKPPSTIYQPPDFEFYDSTSETPISNFNINSDSEEKRTRGKFSPQTDINEKRWKDLRLLFLIPDYEFPLDPVTRPGYDNSQSSFDVNPIPADFQEK